MKEFLYITFKGISQIQGAQFYLKGEIIKNEHERD